MSNFKKLFIIFLMLITFGGISLSIFSNSQKVESVNETFVEAKAEGSQTLHLKINSEWCIKNNNLDTEDWGGDGYLYACFYTVMPSNVDDKKTDDYASDSWPGTRMTTVTSNGRFSYAWVTVPEGAKSVCFNSGDTGNNSHCRVQIKAVPEEGDNKTTFYVDTNYTDWQVWYVGYCQNGAWDVAGIDSYIVGSGSFVNGSPDWAINTGVKFNYRRLANGYIGNQYFDNGDILHVVNDNGQEFGWTSLTETPSFCVQTVMTKKNGRITCGFWLDDDGGGLKWWRKAGKFIRIKTTGSSDDSHNEIIDIIDDIGTAGDKKVFEFEMYTDVTSITFVPITVSGDTRTEDTSHVFSQSLSTNWDTNARKWRVYYQYLSDHLDYSTYATGNNIKITKSGYYSVLLTSANGITMTTCETFTPSEGLYFDITNAKDDWLGVGIPPINAWFYNTEDSDTGSPVQGGEMHGHGTSSTIIEFNIPLLSNGLAPNRVNFYIWDSEQGKNIVETATLTYSYQYNYYTLTGKHSSSSTPQYYGNWTGIISTNERIEYYGVYFNECVVCEEEGYISKDEWPNAEVEFYQICDFGQERIFQMEASLDGTEIGLALSKYDYIIDKYPDKQANDFIGRNEQGSGKVTPPSSGVNPLFNIFNSNSDNGAIIIMIVASSMALLSVTALSILIVKKRKVKQD